MPTTRKPRLTLPDTQGVALVPINRDGQMIAGAGSFPMPDDPNHEGEEFEQEELHEPSPSERVSALLANVVTGDEKARVTVYRKIAATGKQAWCGDFKPDEFEAGGLDMLGRKFGAGEFVVTLFGITRGGQFGIKTRAEISIDAASLPVMSAPAPGTHAGESPALIALLEKLAMKADAPPVDPMASMRATFEMMTMMRTAMGMNDKAPEKSSVAELVDAIKELRGAKDLIEGKEEDDSLLGMAKGLIPMVGEMIGKSRLPAPITPLPPIAIANGSPDGPTDAAGVARVDNRSQEEIDMGIAEAAAALRLKMTLGAILKMAEMKLDPQQGADVIYDRLPDEWVEMLSLPVWFEMLAEQVPQALPHKEWLTQARNLTLAMFVKAESEGDEDEDAAPASDQSLTSGPEQAPATVTDIKTTKSKAAKGGGKGTPV